MNKHLIFNYKTSVIYAYHVIINLLINRLRLNNFKIYYHLSSNVKEAEFIHVTKEYKVKKMDLLPKVSEEQNIYFSKNSSRLFQFRVNNAVIDALSSRIYTPNGHLLGDATPWNPNYSVLRWPRQIPEKKMKNLQTLEGLCTFIGSQAYFHWLMEDLPPLIRITKQEKNIPVFVAPGAEKYVLEFLDLLRIKYQVSPPYFKVSQLIYESRGPALIPQSNDVSTLEEFSNAIISNETYGKKIYISRRDSGRFPKNEKEIEELMKKNGIKIVSLTGLPAVDQIKLFKNAELVIGTHGAGLTNIVWSQRKKAKLIEIRIQTQPKCFERLASHKEIAYHSLESASNREWIVEIKKLEKLLGVKIKN